MRALDTLVKLYILLTALDLFIGWVQVDPRQLPRRITHALTEPVQALLRRLMPARLTGGWDLSPVVLIVALGALRLTWIQP